MLPMNHILYRLYRLRRLLVLCSLLPVIGLVSGATLSGSDWMVNGMSPFWFLFATAAVLFLILVVYPASWIESLAMSLSMMTVLFIMPFLRTAPGLMMRPDPSDRWFLLVFSMAVLWVALSLALVMVICAFERVGMGQTRVKSVIATDLTPEQALNALVLRPETTLGARSSGPVGQDGFFDVTIRFVMPEPPDFEPVEQEHMYRARIIQTDGNRQVTMCVLECEGRVSTSVIEHKFHGGEGKTICEITEVQDHLTLAGWVGYWLNDFGGDYLVAEMDAYAKRPTLAICRQPQITLLSQLARLVGQDQIAG